MLRLKELNYQVEGKQLINGLSLHIEQGLYHLLGVNGAGKSTLLNLIAGLAALERGNISLNGLDLSQLSKQIKSRNIAYLTQHQSMHFALTVEQMLLIALDALHLKLPDPLEENELICQLDINSYLKRPLNQLSGGERQRAHLARVLLQSSKNINPDCNLLLLDEPFTGLDVSHKYWLTTYLESRASEQIVLVCHHELNLSLQKNTRCILLGNGRLIGSDNARKLLDSSVLKEQFQLPLSALKYEENEVSQIIGL